MCVRVLACFLTTLQATLTEYSGCRDNQGLCHGEGHAVFTSGIEYDGSWQNGHMHGQGSIKFPDGVSYSGSFEVDSISGSGASCGKSGKTGGCHAGSIKVCTRVPHHQLVATCPLTRQNRLFRTRTQVYSWGEGASYEGEVLNGLRHGYGRLSVAGSPVVFEGQWHQGKRHGKGALYYNAARTALYEGGLPVVSTRQELHRTAPSDRIFPLRPNTPHTPALSSCQLQVTGRQT